MTFEPLSNKYAKKPLTIKWYFTSEQISVLIVNVLFSDQVVLSWVSNESSHIRCYMTLESHFMCTSISNLQFFNIVNNDKITHF